MHADSRMVLGILAGVAAGAIAGILFAPDKGAETRKKISKATSDMGGDLKNKFKNLKGKVKDSYANARDEMEDVEEKSIPGYK